jgi:hypothetical protein
MMWILLEVSNQNTLLGFLPESVGLLIFGLGLIALPIAVRSILSRVETVKDNEQIELEN